jgi:hypothetical protein
MIIARYAHRLPADYDLGIIRTRAETRGPQWNATPGLYFKAFLLRERGRFGATANSYTSLYLWRDAEPFRDFLAADPGAPANSFATVTNSFGRPQIQTWLPLDAGRGTTQEARFVYMEEQNIPADADLPTVLARETQQNRKASEQFGVLAAVAGVDTLNWKLVRILVSANEPGGSEAGDAYQILHLAQPLLGSLPEGAAR